MSTDPAAFVRHARGTHGVTVADLVSLGGILDCSAMTWVTQKELDEGEQ